MRNEFLWVEKYAPKTIRNKDKTFNHMKYYLEEV